MRPRLGKHLGCISEVEGSLYVDENKDRRLCTIGAKDVELFDFRRPIGYLSRLSDTGASGFAVRDESRVRLAVEWFVIGLIIGGIEFELVVI